jgi:hypothetical protein
MRRNSVVVGLFGVVFGFAVLSGAARADDQPPPPPPPQRLGVGYKIGNGLGLLGADVVVGLVEHLSLDLQVNYAAASTAIGNASGFGFAPAVHVELFPTGSTPYLALGYVYLKLQVNDVEGSASGYFANLGYNWKWASGLGIVVGAGVVFVPKVSATNGVETIETSGGAAFNIEAGIRYMFL